jgi:hypothetical protein
MGQKEVDVTKHPLPSVLDYHSESMGDPVEAFTEYVLVATFEKTTAHHPIYVRKQSVLDPITDYRMRTYTKPNVARPLKLLPKHAEKLSFSQKSSMFFHGKTPKYSYTVNVEFPQIIQLEHQDLTPLKIHIIPYLDP